MNIDRSTRLAGPRPIITVTSQAILIAAVPIMYFNHPVLYIRFIAEDNWGEWATSVALMFACLLFIIAFLNTRDKKRRVWYTLLAVGTFLIAGEEVSWGQRVVAIRTPDFLNAINFQGEIGFHNIRAISPDELTYLIVSLCFFVYGVVLPTLVVIFPKIELAIVRIGLPLPRLQLSLLFAATAYFLGFSTFAKSDEIGELFMGLSLSCLGLQLALTNDKLRVPWVKAAAVPIFIASVLALGILLTSAHLSFLQIIRKSPPAASPPFIVRLNRFAADNYPSRGQYKQAAQIYSYLEKNPELVKDDWLINKAEVWQKMNREAEAKMIFQDALILETTRYNENPQDAGVVTRLARIYTGLEDDTLSRKFWNEALALHESKMAITNSSDGKARLRITRARTYLAMGEYNNAISEYVKASNLAITARSKNHIIEGIDQVRSLCQPEALKTLGLRRGGKPIVRLMQWHEVQEMSQQLERNKGKSDWCGKGDED